MATVATEQKKRNPLGSAGSITSSFSSTTSNNGPNTTASKLGLCRRIAVGDVSTGLKGRRASWLARDASTSYLPNPREIGRGECDPGFSGQAWLRREGCRVSRR